MAAWIQVLDVTSSGRMIDIYHDKPEKRDKGNPQANSRKCQKVHRNLMHSMIDLYNPFLRYYIEDKFQTR